MPNNEVIDFNKLHMELDGMRSKYLAGNPFPHIVIDDFLSSNSANKTLKQFPAVSNQFWIHYVHYNERKLGLNKRELIPEYINEKVIGAFHSNTFLQFLSALTGVNKLVADDTLEGGGLHQCLRGGHLNIHSDFNAHPHDKKLKRRINVLLFLNKNWVEEYKGSLEFWNSDMSKCGAKYLPVFNRLVIFETHATSYHGFPERVMCPSTISRKSIALYFYTCLLYTSPSPRD